VRGPLLGARGERTRTGPGEMLSLYQKMKRAISRSRRRALRCRTATNPIAILSMAVALIAETTPIKTPTVSQRIESAEDQ